MMRLMTYLKPYALQIVAVFILVFAQVMADLQLPDYMAKIVNEGIVGENSGLVLNTGLRMLLISLLGAACTVGVGFLAARIATGFSMNIRERVFAKTESFSLAEFDRFSTASLITRSTNDITQIQMMLIVVLRIVLMAPIMGIGAVIKAYGMAPSMTWIIALAVTVIVGMMIVMFVVAMPKFKLLQKLVDRLNLVTRQNLTGLRVIRAFNTEKHEEAEFEKANIDLTAVNLFANRMMVFMQPMMMLVFNITAITIIWVGSHLIGTGDLKIGDMIAFMQYAMQVIMSFLMISIMFIMVPRASVSGQRVMEVIEIEPVIKDPQQAQICPQDKRGLVEFRNVTFAYPDADLPVLQDISFTAEPGQTTAFIGSTGSGKSTLINLIPRFYDVTDGQVLVSGVDVRDLKLEDLYSKIGYIPQKGVLFSGTVASNIKYGDEQATDVEIIQAAKIAQADEFIEQLQDSYESPIAQGGANVSGGQKQRLAIARAIVKKPEIFIFDDSFSALDFKTDAALRQALSEATKDITVLIVAQRIGTIVNADKIVVLDDGRIVGIGSHAELLRSCPVYTEIASSQLSDEELALGGDSLGHHKSPSKDEEIA